MATVEAFEYVAELFYLVEAYTVESCCYYYYHCNYPCKFDFAFLYN